MRLEVMNTTADHNVLYQLSANTNGEMIYPDQVAELAEKFVQAKLQNPYCGK